MSTKSPSRLALMLLMMLFFTMVGKLQGLPLDCKGQHYMGLVTPLSRPPIATNVSQTLLKSSRPFPADPQERFSLSAQCKNFRECVLSRKSQVEHTSHLLAPLVNLAVKLYKLHANFLEEDIKISLWLKISTELDVQFPSCLTVLSLLSITFLKIHLINLCVRLITCLVVNLLDIIEVLVWQSINAQRKT